MRRPLSTRGEPSCLPPCSGSQSRGRSVIHLPFSSCQSHAAAGSSLPSLYAYQRAPRRMSSAAFKTAHPHTKAHKQRPTVAFINVWPRGKEGSCSRKEEVSYKNRDGSEGSRQKSFHSEFEMVFRSHAHSTAFVLLFARKWVKRPLPSFLSPFYISSLLATRILFPMDIALFQSFSVRPPLFHMDFSHLLSRSP